MFTATDMQDIDVPREMSLDDIKQTVQDLRHAACRAIEAGADGVEIHGGNGYLVQQFFAPNAKTHTDECSDSIENRARLPIVVDQPRIGDASSRSANSSASV